MFGNCYNPLIFLVSLYTLLIFISMSNWCNLMFIIIGMLSNGHKNVNNLSAKCKKQNYINIVEINKYILYNYYTAVSLSF